MEIEIKNKILMKDEVGKRELIGEVLNVRQKVMKSKAGFDYVSYVLGVVTILEFWHSSIYVILPIPPASPGDIAISQFYHVLYDQ